MMQVGSAGLILIVLVALILFGPSKLPELGRAFGKTLKEFKSATKGLTDEEEDKEHQEKKHSSGE